MKRTPAECKALLAAHRAEHYDIPRRRMEYAQVIERQFNIPNRNMAIIQKLQKIWELF